MTANITHTYRLKESKVFCMVPWVHIFNSPSGDVQPCCVSLDGTMGNLYDTDVTEIWNNQRYKEFRKELLSDTPSKHCERCYKEEKWGNNVTLRQQFNTDFAEYYKDLIEDSTNQDGTATKMNFLRWDFRFSNLCNLACIGCSPEYSSTWGPLYSKMNPEYKEVQFKNSNKNKDKFIEIIKSQSDKVVKIYFAGGEPLIQPEHYQILEEIRQQDRLDKIDVTYSTNLNTLFYKSTNVIDYWKDIKKLRILVSLDEVDPVRLHYIRYPSEQHKIIENIKLLNQSLTKDGQDWVITPTWNILNMHRIKDIVKFFYDNNLLPKTFFKTYIWEYDIHNIVLLTPERLCVSGASAEHKELIHTRLNEYEEWYISTLIPLKEPKLREHSKNIIKSQMERFHKAVNETNTTTTKDRADWFKLLDSSRGTDFKSVFTELNSCIKKE